MKIRKNCPVCKSFNLKDFITRFHVPIHQNYLIKSQKAAEKVISGNLNLVICKKCGFVFNNKFDQSKMSYGKNYENTQNYSSYFDNYTTILANYLIKEKKIQNCKIIEIGCGKGFFLRKFVKNKKFRNTALGFDPSYLGPKSLFNGRLKFVKKFYNESYTKTPADLIICRHVIEHIPEPIKFLKTLRNALKNTKSTLIFFETPSLEWILKEKVVWDFFYEHCSYFSQNSLRTAFELSGFKVKCVKIAFNGQYLWLEAIPSRKKLVLNKRNQRFFRKIDLYKKAEKEKLDYWNYKIGKISRNGKIAVWGAGAKGVTFLNIFDSQRKLIDCAIDVNPNKQRKYIPGTGHSIISYSSIPKRKIKYAILMNPNYYKEIIKLLNTKKIKIEIINA